MSAFKEAAAKMAREKKQPINPIAKELGLTTPSNQYYNIEAGENPAEHYYQHFLMLSEQLFEGEVDMAAYEESMRVMFFTKAYTVFTLDRLVAAIVKQVRLVVNRTDISCK
jgi:paired amphipathic helix protein Sin3a